MVENIRGWRSFVSIQLLVKKLCCTKKKRDRDMLSFEMAHENPVCPTSRA